MNRNSLTALVDGLRVAYVKLTNAEIKALAATQKVLVPAQGPNTIVQLVSAVLVLRAGTNALTESADNMQIVYNAAGGTAASAAIEATGFIDQTTDTAAFIPGATIAAGASSAVVNKPLVLDNTGDGEYAGNAANDATMDVFVTYRVLRLP